MKRSIGIHSHTATPPSLRAGFTLVELLFTILILVISGLGILGAYTSSFKLVRVAQQTNIAMNDVRDIIERIKSTSFTQLTTNFPNGAANGIVGTGADKYGVIIGGYTLPTEQITVTYQPNTTADPVELVVQLQWTSGGRTYQQSFSTIRASKAS